jgi:hypothetical protein
LHVVWIGECNSNKRSKEGNPRSVFVMYRMQEKHYDYKSSNGASNHKARLIIDWISSLEFRCI